MFRVYWMGMEVADMKRFIIKNKAIKRVVMDYLQTIDSYYKPYEVIIRPYRKQRSKDQNARYWGILSQIANETGHTTSELHEIFKADLLPRKLIAFKGIDREVNTSTVELSTQEFADYCTRVEAFAAEQGIRLVDPTYA
ncbi:hypothetical protein LCGC14_2650970 [marine sediment metagenome]|uniref:NinB protein n=1 Tax=marine sediment metagenome TaxID=412755 RepID=A0A0F8ZUT1_9ZZZZ